MARAVYYDPFGQRTAGYRMGVQDEVTLQDQTRRARGSDWDFQNIAPLRLNAAQRADQLGEFAQPYLQNQYGIDQRRNLAALYPAEQTNFERIGQATGNYAPALTNAQLYGSGTSLGSEEVFAPMVRQNFDMFQANQGIGPANYGTPEYLEALYGMYGVRPEAFQQFQQQQTGALGQNAEMGYDQFLGYDRSRQMAMDMQRMQEMDWQRQIQQDAAQRGQQSIDQTGQYYRDLGTYGRGGAAGAGALEGMGYTGAEDGF